jgi:trigger factor
LTPPVALHTVAAHLNLEKYMPVTIENVGPCRKKLRVEVPAGRVAGTRAEIVEEFRKEAALPGFRPGKAPEPMVAKRFAKEIDEEVRKRLIPDSYREALREQKLRVVGMPQIESVEENLTNDLVYVATVDTAPEFTLPEYKGVKLTKQEQPVTDEDVTKLLDNMRDQQADFATIEDRGLQAGDFAVVTYAGTIDGKPIAEVVPDLKTLGEQKDFWLLVQSDSFLPGFCDQLLGAKTGEKRQVQVDFPADFPQKLIAGAKAAYAVEVTGIREKKLPELNDEFAKRLGAESLEKLREDARKGLTAERTRQADAELRRQLVDHLLSKVEFELPEGLVAQETRQIVYDLVRENTMRGASKEQLAEKKDELYAAAQESAKERLRSSFILDEIARLEKITVAEDEVNSRLAEMAERYRVTPDRLRAQLAERDQLDDVAQQVLVAKTLDFLIASAKLETK